MLHPSTKKLIDRLAEMTERGKLTWNESNAGVVYATEGYSVLLASDPSDLVITSKDGKELERASAEELKATPTETGGTYADLVAAMTKEATRIARGTETAISSLMADMDESREAVIEAAPVTAEEAVEDVVDDTQVVATDDAPEIHAEETTQNEPAPEEEATETVEAAPEQAEIETPEADSEPDVQEAVARMANEVNNRTEDNLVAEAGRVAAAVGIAAVDISDKDSEPDTEAPAEIEAVAAPAADTDHHYVPFGLSETTEGAANQGFVPISDTGILEDTEVAIAPTIEAQEFTPDAAEAPIPNGLDVMAGPAGDIIDDFTEPAFEGGAQPDFSEQVEVVPVEAVEEAAPIEPEVAPETEPAPQNYSLSGIGAGFGLGALTATTEASGVPSANAAPEEEKIIIDATDDVPYTHPEPVEETVEASGLPDVASLEQPAAEPAQPAAETVEEPAESDDTPVLKPRTRFNPWS